jgi:hypothetical protein
MRGVCSKPRAKKLPQVFPGNSSSVSTFPGHNWMSWNPCIVKAISYKEKQLARCLRYPMRPLDFTTAVNSHSVNPPRIYLDPQLSLAYHLLI